MKNLVLAVFFLTSTLSATAFAECSAAAALELANRRTEALTVVEGAYPQECKTLGEAVLINGWLGPYYAVSYSCNSRVSGFTTKALYYDANTCQSK